MGWNNVGSLKGPAGSGGSNSSWDFGPVATANAAYRNRIQSAATSKVKFLLLGDSTGDSFSNGLPGASDSWDKTWMVRFAALMRKQLGLPEGGRGFIAPSNPTWPGGYNYRPAELTPTGYTKIDDIGFSTGMPGTLWLQRPRNEGGVYADTVTYSLSPKCTSVDILLTAYGPNIEITTAKAPYSRNYQSVNPDERRWITIFDPGTSITLRTTTNSGFAVLGINEYCGDEMTGINTMNLAVAGIQASDVLSWLVDDNRSTKKVIQQYAPDVVLLLLGSNDTGGGGQSAQTAWNSHKSIMSQIRSVSPNTLFGLVTRWNADVDYQQMVTLMKNEAASAGAFVIDIGADNRLNPANPGVYLSDNEHYTTSGDIIMAQALTDLMRATNAAPVTRTVVQEMIDTTVKRPKKLRRLTYGAGGQGNTVTAAQTFQQRGLRIPVQLFCDTTRWRIRAWNNNYVHPVVARPNMTGKGLVIADAADTIMLPDGNFRSGAIVSDLIVGDWTIPGAVPVGGDYYNSNVYTSPWFDQPSQQFKDGVTRILGTGVTLAASGANSSTEQLGLFSAAAADGINPANRTWTSGSMPFSLFIEYETVTDKEVALFVCDSISAGITGYKGAAQASYMPIPSYLNYPNHWAKLNNVLVQQIGFSGVAARNFNAADTLGAQLYGRHDLTSPQFDLLAMAVGSNDAALSASVADFQTAIKSILDNLKPKLAAGAEIWYVNATPRGLATGAEAFRVTYNDWASTLPYGFTGVVDMDGAFNAGSNALKASLSMDGTHWSLSGQVRGATELERIRKRAK